MTAPKRITRWYEKNGVPFLEEDWGPRDDNGETAVKDTSAQSSTYGGWGAHSRTRLVDGTWSTFWEDKRPPWAQRDDREQEYVEKLEAFFAPYLSMLGRKKGNIIRQLINDRLTYEEVGENEDMSRQGAWKAMQAAVRELTRLIANDDPHFTPPVDRRRRDFAGEREAAGRVFRAYWKLDQIREEVQDGDRPMDDVREMPKPEHEVERTRSGADEVRSVPAPRGPEPSVAAEGPVAGEAGAFLGGIAWAPELPAEDGTG